MAEPRGPPCGFLGLDSSGASGNNGDGRDFDLVLQANVGRYEVVDAASDASMPGTGGNQAVDDTKEGNSKRLCTNRHKQTGRRGWSKETWAGVRLDDVRPPEPFAWMVSKAMKTVNRKESLPENLKPYTRSELLEIVGMFPEAPPSAYEIKSARESRMDIAEGRFKYEKDSARHTKGGTTMVIDENYLYSLVPQTKLGGPQRIDRTNTLNNLEMLLVRIADGNLGNTQPEFLNRKLSDDVAAKKLRYEQTIRSAEGFTELSYLIKGYYDKVYEKAVRTWKHREDELYYHPEDRLVRGLARGVNEESVHRQLSTFTEVNVNSWAETDSQNPVIVRSNKGVRILSNDDPDLAFDERKEIEFPGAEAQADQLVPERVEEARQSMLIQDTSLKKSNEEWEIYIESLIAELGEEYLTGGEITISINDKVSKLLFKLKEDPNEATSAFFNAKGVQDIKEKDFVSVLQIIQGHLEEERGTVRSPYWRMLQFQKELVLRKLRLEIINKISNHQWYFVLQKIPPLEIKVCMTRCAYPNCDYHEFEFMPAEGYRMVFMNSEHCCEPEYKLDDVREGPGTPGRTKDGQMLFCVSCVENLFNGVGLIKTKPSALGRRSACLEKAAPPDVPIIEPKVMAPGLSIFAATLHTFIKPEIRYSWHEFWSLNSYEYHALMKWKNMCIRKTMWEIPSNRAFNLQILRKAADYDFVNFFGDDVLDIGEPRPNIVLGIDLKMEQVSADDISTLENQKPSRADAVKNFYSIKRKHPLSNVMNADDIGTSKLGHSAGASIVDKLNIGRTRIVKPLSEIMKLIDYRVQKAWGAMKPPYVPRPQRGIVDVPYRKWPPTYLWRSDYSKEWETEKIRKQQKTIDSNYETINRTLEAQGLGDLINYQPKNDEDMSEDLDAVSPPYTCVICGTTNSLEWRRGPKGPKTLCNACGIRFFRDRGRLMVPVPE